MSMSSVALAAAASPVATGQRLNAEKTAREELERRQKLETELKAKEDDLQRLLDAEKLARHEAEMRQQLEAELQAKREEALKLSTSTRTRGRAIKARASATRCF